MYGLSICTALLKLLMNAFHPDNISDYEPEQNVELQASS